MHYHPHDSGAPYCFKSYGLRCICCTFIVNVCWMHIGSRKNVPFLCLLAYRNRMKTGDRVQTWHSLCRRLNHAVHSDFLSILLANGPISSFVRCAWVQYFTFRSIFNCILSCLELLTILHFNKYLFHLELNNFVKDKKSVKKVEKMVSRKYRLEAPSS